MLVDDGLTPLLSLPTCLCSSRPCLTCFFGRGEKAGLLPLCVCVYVCVELLLPTSNREQSAHVTSHTKKQAPVGAFAIRLVLSLCF